MMRPAGFLRAFLIAAAVAAAPALAFGLEEQSLLTPDGTLHVLRSGRAVDLGIADATIPPESNVIDWTAKAQDGAISTAILPQTVSYSTKRNLQLAYDNETQTLLLLWTEDGSYSQVRIGVLHNGNWSNKGLLPSQGISLAYNPRMALTHQQVSYTDENDQVVSKTSSILSIIWWEEALLGQARLAILFLDETKFDPQSLAIYNAPTLAGSGPDVTAEDVPSGAYLFPTLQADGLNGAFLVSYADLNAARQRVLRISFPDDQGKPSDQGSLKWQRRHIPIVGIRSDGPLPLKVPDMKDKDSVVGTTVGAGYRPTLYWRDGDNLRYIRLEGADWSDVRSIAIDDTTTYEKALELVSQMAGRN